MLGERATTEIHRNENSQGIPKLKDDAKVGGDIAGGARKKLEKRLGRAIVSKKNYLPKIKNKKVYIKNKTKNRGSASVFVNNHLKRFTDPIYSYKCPSVERL